MNANVRRFTDRSKSLHKAVGRLFMEMNGDNYYCSGTVVEGPDDRVIIATAAHCLFDWNGGAFASNFVFIPGQGKPLRMDVVAMLACTIIVSL